MLLAVWYTSLFSLLFVGTSCASKYTGTRSTNKGSHRLVSARPDSLGCNSLWFCNNREAYSSSGHLKKQNAQ